MKKSLFFIITLLSSQFAHAMCTEQYFPSQNEGDPGKVYTFIRDQSSNYDTHDQWINHRQCWNSHGIDKPHILVAFGNPSDAGIESISPNFKVSNHGVLQVFVKNIHHQTDQTSFWDIELLNYNDTNVIINDVTKHCVADYRNRNKKVICY